MAEIQMTDEQFEAFRVMTDLHNHAVQESLRLSLEATVRSAEAAENPKPAISLRDYFAGQALTAAMDMNPHLPGDPADPRVFPGAAELAERRAKWAYLHADAMLAAREAGQ